MSLTNEEKRNLVASMETMQQKRAVAKALNIEFELPSVEDQVTGSGSLVSDHKRGRAKEGRDVFVIPEVELSDNEKANRVLVDPRIARAVAAELLRLADNNNL